MYNVNDIVLYRAYTHDLGANSGDIIEGMIVQPLGSQIKGLHRVADPETGDILALLYSSEIIMNLTTLQNNIAEMVKL